MIVSTDSSTDSLNSAIRYLIVVNIQLSAIFLESYHVQDWPFI